MTRPTILFGGLWTLCCLCVVLAATSTTLAQTQDQGTQTLALHLSLRFDDAGAAKLYLEMPVNKDTLRSLIDAREKRPNVFLAATKNVPYGEVAKTIEMLESLGLNRISLDTKHASKP